uniref:Coiled-coil domain containing 151 n=1 Tax=Neogobius melanostomus TaxID=47308 RepID=A0A8C6UEE0_9GOBI
MCPPEGERTAFYESSQANIKKNKETIQQLRGENTSLYKKLAAGDKHVVKVAFQNMEKISEKDAFCNMSSKTALATLDRKIQTKKKRLNAQKHITRTLQQRRNELKLEYERLKALSDDSTKTGEDDAVKLRTLENNLEKTLLKCKEAENITRNYLAFKSHLQEESLHYPGQLDSLEEEVLKYKDDLQTLKAMKHEAQLSAEASKAELQQREELLYKDRKERERYKTKVEEHKIQTEKVERRAQRTGMQPDDLGSEPQRSTTRVAAEDEQAMSTFEDVFRQIKEATGVTDIQEVAERFVTQKGIREHLEKLIEENKNTLAQLKEQKEQLNQQFEEKKYSGEADISRDQHILEDCEQELQAAQRRCDGAKESLAALDKTLGTYQAGVEHLAVKLQHITLVTIHPSIHPFSSTFPLVDLLHVCELKLQSLHSELQGEDLSAVMKMMDDDKVTMHVCGMIHAVTIFILKSACTVLIIKGECWTRQCVWVLMSLSYIF